MESKTPLIGIHNVCKTYGNGQKQVSALQGISFDIYEQEFLSIVGTSGAGKSTLLHVLGTLDRPSQGEVVYRGKDVFSWRDKELAQFRNQKIGFVFQLHYLLPEFSALENTMMPALIRGIKKGEAKEKAETILIKMGLKERILHKPGELSGGEQQRVAIARALVLKPEIILADEPTGNLDSETGKLIFDLLFKLNIEEKIVMVVVTHNESLASQTPRLITLKDGIKIGDTYPVRGEA
ncbi:MAG: ABC transporter ATP-binding protein [Thermodesulfobacteriota bacterium]|nr:MAG: ABC transporter ATP-binding protein [Thermodesulfobacteriota bacterium]